MLNVTRDEVFDRAVREEFGRRVRARLDELGMTQRDFARTLGVTPSFLNQLLKGVKLWSLARAIEVIDHLRMPRDTIPRGVELRAGLARLGQRAANTDAEHAAAANTDADQQEAT